jgi:hypothetical protein
MSYCKRCLLPKKVQGAALDARGICRLCREYPTQDRTAAERARQLYEADLEKALRDCRKRGKYDCLVPLSGGKDSVYLIYKLKNEYGLKVLAHTTDINLGAIAWDNIHRAIAKLDVEHIVYRPSNEFYRKLFRFLLMNQEARGAVHTVSYVYAPLFEGNALTVAMEKGIPLILAGYSPGQPDPERMVYEFPRRAIAGVDWTPPELRESGLFDESELARFWNPKRYPPGTSFPRYLAPYHAWSYNQDEIMRKVVTLGLIATSRHASPVYSNYPINWLLMYSDLMNFGYNPYAPEFANLIREGKANRHYWKIMWRVVDFMIRHKFYLGREISTHLKWLDLTPQDLTIRRPSRPEWPDFVREAPAQAAPTL